MTKNEELQILREAAEKLGPDSYCGPWLRTVIPIIERDIRSDNPPDPITHRQYAAQIMAEAEEVLRRAKADADIVMHAAKKKLEEAGSIRLTASRAVAQANRDLEKLVRSLA